MSRLVDAARRLWAAAYALDEQRGDTRASDWTVERVLVWMDRDVDPAEVEAAAGLLERRLGGAT